MKEDMINRLHEDVQEERNNSDGIYQFITGLAMVLFALLNLLDSSGNSILFLFLFFAMIPILVTKLRKRITYPRIGYAKMKDVTPTRISIQRFILSILLTGVITYFMLTNTEVFPQSSSKLFFPAMLIIYLISFLIGIVTYIRKRKPNLVYLLTYLVAGASWILWISPEKWHIRISIETAFQILLGLGLLNLIYGLFVLRAFIRKYPVLQDEEA